MKRSETGAVSTGLIVLITLLALLIIVVVPSYISAVNWGNRTEQALLAKVENNENIYANGTQKIIEIAQVPAMYAADVSKITKEAITGRYGADGSKAVFQMLQEQNPQLDASMYKKIQQVIEAFRNEFQQNQTEMIDMKRNYLTALGSVWQGMWLRIAGYPKTDLSKFAIVTTDKAAETFRTHRDTGIQLRPSN
jgi:Tfp pilus assembly protein PilE